MASDKESSGFPELPESLIRWPYAARQLLQAPHPKLIEAHAWNLLSRALNVGRLTAFVGSGASMAYGRISWKDMLYAAPQDVLERAKLYSDAQKHPHIDRLKKLIEVHKIERDTKASVQLSVFQLTEELEKILREVIEKPLSHTFRDTVMWVTRDDRGHAERLLFDVFLDRDVPASQIQFEDLSKDGPFRKFIRGENGVITESGLDEKIIKKIVQCALWGNDELDYKGRFLPLCLNRSVEYNRLLLTFKEELCWIVYDEGIANSLTSDFEKFLSIPAQRYRLAARLRNLPEWQRFLALEALAKVMDELRKIQERVKEKHSRADILAYHQDPLLILHRELNIRRFLTTNYDYEIERMFENLGYPCASEVSDLGKSSKHNTDDPIAPIFKEVVFDRHSTGELAVLAISDRSRRRDNWVAHLHGRAEVNGKGRIIVTEDDYQQRYARDDEYRSLVDDAIKLVFAAQPILFVGIGMAEVDLLRPLREFMSDSTRLGDRFAVALLPSEGSEEKEAESKIELLRRYGVYSIHYGWASMEEKTGGKKEEDSSLGIRWLALIKEIKDKAEIVLDLFGNPTKSKEDWNQHYASIQKSSREFSRFLSNLYEKKQNCPFFFDNPAFFILKVPSTFETIPAKKFSSERGIKLEQELDVINNALMFVERLCVLEVKVFDTFINDRLNSICCLTNNLHSSKIDWHQLRRDAQTHRANLAGAYTTFNTICLCAALMHVAKEWKDWREEWRKLPVPASSTHDIAIPMNFPLGYRYGRTKSLKVVLRHALNLRPNLEHQENRYKRFYAGAPSQTYNSLMSALKRERLTLQTIKSRRIFLLIARRGLGRGHFFAALQPPDINGDKTKQQEQWRLTQLLRMIGPKAATWAGATFFNFSFSLEVGSVFDRFASLLWDCWWRQWSKVQQKEEKALFELDWQSVQNNRIERLRFILRLYKEHRPDYRIFAAFNGISIMFDREGHAKNGQIQQLFETLIDSDFHELPIDIMFVCNESAIPEYFRKQSRSPSSLARDNQALTLPQGSGEISPVSLAEKFFIPLKELRRADMSEKAKLALANHNKLLKLNIGNDSQVVIQTNFVHLLHEARASVLVNAFFPLVALIIAWYQIQKLNDEERKLLLGYAPEEKDNDFCANFFRPGSAQDTRVAIKALLGAGPDNRDTFLFKQQKKVFPLLMAAFAMAFENSRKDPENWEAYPEALLHE